MSQERGQRSIRSFFTPMQRPSPSAAGGGDGAASPNENESQNAARTPVSSQKRGRASAARTGIHVFAESPVSSRKQEDSADPPAAKRNRRTVDLSDSGSGEEWLPDAAAESPVSQRKSIPKSAAATSVIQTPTSTARRNTSTPISSSAASLDHSFAGRTPTSCRAAETVPQSAAGEEDITEWPPKDSKYRFLWPQNIRDADGKWPDDPDYDPTTLRVPADFMRDQTAAKAQWWAIKSKHMDTVLFFKGKICVSIAFHTICDSKRITFWGETDLTYIFTHACLCRPACHSSESFVSFPSPSGQVL